MTVRVEKPSVNLREKLAELDKPTGIAGEAMLRAETPQEQQALIGVGRRNMIINGDFQIWQRGTSGTSGYVADRFKGIYGTSQSKQYDADIGNYMQITTNNGAIMYYGVELMETGKSYPFFVDRTYTLSCKIKSTSKISAINFGWRDGVGSGTYTDITSFTAIKEHTGSGEWEDVVYQVNVNVAPHGNAKVFQILFIGTSGVQYNIAQVQLELGKVATPFEHRSYGEELALCQRFFCKTYSDGTAIGTATGTGAIMSAAYGTITYASAGTWHFPVEMRAAPTVTLYSTANANTTGKVTADSTDGTGAANYISTNSAVLYRNNDSTGVAANVFLRVQATANAEL